MTTVLRVKRRNDGEPLDALVLACKQQKLDDHAECSDPVSTIAKFAGTLEDPGENVVQRLVKVLEKDELKANFKRHPVNILAKARKQNKQQSQANRYKVINCMRSLDTSNVEEFEDKTMTLIDVEDSVSCATKQQDMAVRECDDYVYDLYYAYTQDEVFNSSIDMSICVLDQEADYDALKQQFVYDGQEDTDGYMTEDSNSESNFRNDYPDTEPSDESSDEAEMREAVKNMDVSVSDADEFTEYDPLDVEFYGYEYARHKQKILRSMREEDFDDFTEDESDDSNEEQLSEVDEDAEDDR